MTMFRGCRWSTWLALVAVTTLAACTTTKNQAPVEDRGAGRGSAAYSASAAADPSRTGSVVPPAEARPGTYIVKPGDTLMRIALESGQAWRDLARWNGMDNPNVIEVGQVLRVVPPGQEPGAAATKPVATAKVETRPLDGKPASAPASGAASGAQPPASGAGMAAPPTGTGSAAAAAAAASDDDVQWAWPAAGGVITGFDDTKSKGLAIGGKAGDPVLAAADGRVVYAGSGLRGYGNLIIVKHNATYLTAYAHNQTLLVKEDQAVRKGQKIAEMGNSDADRVQLHFEIRRQGKPIDPAKLLPQR
ncbi:MAG TPA: peptidoglycan DD-metalloendopeptidase family protein [Ideonella sp.]|nr:peptidoglycan DD-metalloendopeptidase family protein [Ideonella sp.]HSI46878.1 peptidoglycan DD-metalloendopeptidase family protein [Ideonella sp.]